MKMNSLNSLLFKKIIQSYIVPIYTLIKIDSSYFFNLCSKPRLFAINFVKPQQKIVFNGTNRLVVASFSLAKIFEFIEKENNKEVKKLINKAKQLLEDGNIDEATTMYQDALKVAKTDQDCEDIFFITEQLGIIAFFTEKYADAERLLTEARDYLLRKNSKDDLKLSYVSLKLAETYDCLKNYSKAEEYYKSCSSYLKPKISESLTNKDAEIIELWLMILTSKAHYFLNRVNYEKSRKYFRKAYEICSHYKGDVNEQSVILLQQLGAVCFQKGDLEPAIEYLKKATELGKHLPGMVELSNVYITLGNIYLRQGIVKEAEIMCTQGYKNAVRHDYQPGIKESVACLEELKKIEPLS